MGRKTSEVLADAFLAEEVTTCFALLGDANMHWAARMAEGGCRFVYVRHEHCAVAAAMAYGRASDTVGVATVTCGPGLTQILTALPAAVRARIPLVIFAGEAPLGAPWYNQAIDQAPFVVACGAEYIAAHHPGKMLYQIRDAFLKARTEQRPVVIGVPMDLQSTDWTGPDSLPLRSRDLVPQVEPVPPNPADVARLAAVMNRAERIIIVAGMGARQSGAAEACRKLADRCGALVATTLPARGLFFDHPYNLGIAGGFSSDLARECFARADLVVAVGVRLALHNVDGGKLHPQAEVIQIDTEPAGISQGLVTANLHLRSDAALGVTALCEAVEDRSSVASPQWRTKALAERIDEDGAVAKRENIDDGLLDPRDVVGALDAAIPNDWELVNSSGHCSYFFAQMPRRPAARFLTIREFGAIGNGISFAMGMAAARPESRVVLFDGDGSLLMHIQELETIARHGMRILICVLNDGAFGSEVHKLRAAGLSTAGAAFGHRDLSAISRGFGLIGHRIDDLSDLSDRVAELSESSSAAVWDFHISDQVVSPVIRRAHPTLPES